MSKTIFINYRRDDSSPVARGLRDNLVLDLGKKVVKLGRSSENDFVLDDEKISRFHIQISNLDGEFLSKT